MTATLSNYGKTLSLDDEELALIVSALIAHNIELDGRAKLYEHAGRHDDAAEQRRLAGRCEKLYREI